MIKKTHAKVLTILSALTKRTLVLTLTVPLCAQAALLPPDNITSQDTSTTETISVLLSWSAVSGAASYDYSGFETNVNGVIDWSKRMFGKRVTSDEASCADDGVCSVVENISNTHGAWKIRSNDSASKGNYSSYNLFSFDSSTNTSSNNSGDNDTNNNNPDTILPPSVIAPKGASLSDAGSITLSWNAVPGVSSYDLNGYKTDEKGKINWSQSILSKRVTPEEAHCKSDNICNITETISSTKGAWKIRANNLLVKSDYTPYIRFSLYEPFKIRVKTTTDGVTSNQQFQIPTTGGGYNYHVDCNSDGINEATNVTGNYICNYTSGGSYTISISGSFPQIFFNNEGDRNKLLFIEHWGTGKWRSMERAFMGCETMTSIATDTPNLSLVTNMSHMFEYALSFDQDISNWDVSTITDMNSMFRRATLSTTVYDHLLNNWSQQTLQPNVSFHGGKSKYSSASFIARQSMMTNYNWSISDNGTTQPDQPSQPSASVVRILPLGDSITDSINDRPSYRRSLWNQLQTAGYNVDFVGNSSHTDVTPDYDIDHEGHSGWEAGDINENITAWLTNMSPDIVLLHIGTNDLNRNQSKESTLNEIDGIIQKLRTNNSSIIILLAKIIPMRNYDTAAFNTQFDDFVATRTSEASPIVIVDQYTGYDALRDNYDNFHPDTTGENKMADKWFEALQPYLESQ